jgi:benzoyl-CoA reductase/2-hydroxyglutaryl-CoA dehydratase subunit BcrC/BadD/HgdB
MKQDRKEERKRRFDNFCKAVDVLEKVYEHRKKNPTTKSEEAYYKVMLDEFKHVRDTVDAGKPLIVVTGEFPWEVLDSLDATWFGLVSGGGAVSKMLGLYEATANAASEAGLKPENCSVCRMMAGLYLTEYVPLPDVLIANCIVQCDNISSLGPLLQRSSQVPYFFLDASYKATKRGMQYLAGQTQKMMSFLEGQLGLKTDWDKYEEIFKISAKQYELSLKIRELLRQRPAPGRYRYSTQYHWLQLETSGKQGGVYYMQALVDDLEKRLAERKSKGEVERFRVADVMLFPPHHLKLADWMEETWGAYNVCGVATLAWGKIDFDARKPLDTIVQKFFAEPCVRTYGPFMGPDGALEVIKREVEESQADAGLNFYNRTCPIQSATNRLLSDAMKKELDIPLLVEGMDLMDLRPEQANVVKTKLDDFFKVLAASKK